ncbi:MAG: hypothetical protein JWO73_493 [Candidatus Taylorbacteria bacterium]|nr:hypothetical protein [Candidatus Taylorbacteria bacterium]
MKKIIVAIITVAILLAAGMYVSSISVTKEYGQDTGLQHSTAAQYMDELARKPDIEVYIKLGDEISVGYFRIKPYQIIQDSRCQANANCIWAGTVVVKTHISFKGDGGQDYDIELGKDTITPHCVISLLQIEPKTKTGKETPLESYGFNFKLSPPL